MFQPQILPDQHHMNPALDALALDDGPGVADLLGAHAAVAAAVSGAGGLVGRVQGVEPGCSWARRSPARGSWPSPGR